MENNKIDKIVADEFEELEEIEIEGDISKDIEYMDEDENEEIEYIEDDEEQFSERICKKCGSKIVDGEYFCKVCGKKIRTKENESKFKRNIIISIVIVISILVIGFGAVKVHKENLEKARNEYLSNANQFYVNAVLYAEESEEIMDITLKYWRENIFDNKHGADINEAILNAYIENIDKFSKCKENGENLANEYNKLKTLPKGQEDDIELREIQKAAKKLYTSFKVFNESATNPDGSYESYSEDRNKFISDFNEYGAEMSTYID